MWNGGSRAVYRVRQFCWALHAHVSEGERLEVQRLLRPEEHALFQSMDSAAQRHSLNVWRGAVDAGADEEVFQAALLHDVGKGRPGLFFRVATVLLEALSSSALSRLATADRRSWRYGFHRYLHHAEIGASLLEQSGTSPRIVQLVRAHHSSDTGDSAVELLQRVDEHN